MRYLCLLILTIYSQFDDQNPKDSLNLKTVKSKLEFAYKFDNKDSVSFGYKVFKEDGQILAPNAIQLYKGFIYITDPVKNDIKEINVKSGTIRIIKLQNNKTVGSMIDNFIIFNNLIYIIRLDEYIDIVSFNGKLVKRLKIVSNRNKKFYGSKIINHQSDSTFSIHLEADFTQTENNDFKLFFITINTKNIMTEDSEILEEYDFEENKKNNVRGKMVKVVSNKSTDILKTIYGNFDLDFKLKFDYWTNNILDFSNQQVVMYAVRQNKMILVINNY